MRIEKVRLQFSSVQFMLDQIQRSQRKQLYNQSVLIYKFFLYEKQKRMDRIKKCTVHVHCTHTSIMIRRAYAAHVHLFSFEKAYWNSWNSYFLKLFSSIYAGQVYEIADLFFGHFCSIESNEVGHVLQHEVEITMANVQRLNAICCISKALH